MLLAGGITATVTLPSEEHVTLRIRSTIINADGGWRNCGLRDEGARVSVYVARSSRRIARISPSASALSVEFWRASDEVKLATSALLQLAAGHPMGDFVGYRFQVEDRCGRCGRPLTDPVSIDRGVGPECFGRQTGSRHAEVSAPETDVAEPIVRTEEVEFPDPVSFEFRVSYAPEDEADEILARDRGEEIRPATPGPATPRSAWRAIREVRGARVAEESSRESEDASEIPMTVMRLLTFLRDRGIILWTRPLSTRQARLISALDELGLDLDTALDEIPEINDPRGL